LVATRDVAYGTTVADFLETSGYTCTRCHDARGVLRTAGRSRFDVVVLDIALSDEGDVDLVSFAHRQNRDAQLVLLFDIPQIGRAIEGIHSGAYFYLPTTCPPTDIALVVDKAVRDTLTRSAVYEYEQNLFEETVGATPAMRRVVEMVRKVAPTDGTVLVIGESGTGKEVIADTIHRLSPRRDMPFVAINCAALPESLLESEMFGHVQGAFTGAESDKHGLFEEAEGGTLFLDEIGDMALITQAKLLRVLQNGEIRPVGSSVSRRVDVRVIAATNQDLVEAVQQNQFREDLYFRLNVIQIRIPPLRERMDALPVLVNHFLAQSNARFAKKVVHIDEHAWALLKSYPYPGNVRELDSIIAHAVIMADNDTIRAADLPDSVQEGAMHRLALPNYAADHIPTIEEMEAQLIRSALERLDGNQTEAAKRLGISRSTLWRKMKEYGISS
ncbi:MAG TPA: sigma-54-dependent Fis family transcriptional regulator, partial [Candidatus Hydrogenedentes bacterium]|nr:sigma-54-dependent Fis family transcriptional regulator [Candidatus Hydrogenedentota bacterium]